MEPLGPPEPAEPAEPAEPCYLSTVRNFVFGYREDNFKDKYVFFVNYVDIQSQETQAHTVSLREYANMFTLQNG